MCAFGQPRSSWVRRSSSRRPWLSFDTWVYGSYPTIDKAGSMVFYLDGVHLRMLTDPAASLQDLPHASLAYTSDTSG